MITISHIGHKNALNYLNELLYDWYDPIPPTDLSGIGEEMYRLLQDDFCMELPEVSQNLLGSMNESVISSLENGEDGKWACDNIFTILEDEGLIEIRK